MDSAVVVVSALLLAIERVAYIWVWHRPRQFVALLRRFGIAASPIEMLEALFALFKLIQLGVFVGWFLYWGGSLLPALPTLHVGVGATLLVLVGQALNLAVFYRIGRDGVFYGSRFGRSVPWRTDFPFSVLRHPQYVGTVASIWGLFLFCRWPNLDWAVLPLVETVYYTAGARFER